MSIEPVSLSFYCQKIVDACAMVSYLMFPSFLGIFATGLHLAFGAQKIGVFLTDLLADRSVIIEREGIIFGFITSRMACFIVSAQKWWKENDLNMRVFLESNAKERKSNIISKLPPYKQKTAE
jgi:hypothetical protein